jgi:hypothetical protein
MRRVSPAAPARALITRASGALIRARRGHCDPLKKAIGHPVDPLEDLVAVELATGAALFVAAAGAILRVLRVDDGVAARGAMTAVALATIPLGLAVSAAAQVAALAAIVIAGAVVAGAPHRVTRPIGVPAPAE